MTKEQAVKECAELIKYAPLRLGIKARLLKEIEAIISKIEVRDSG